MCATTVVRISHSRAVRIHTCLVRTVTDTVSCCARARPTNTARRASVPRWLCCPPSAALSRPPASPLHSALSHMQGSTRRVDTSLSPRHAPPCPHTSRCRPHTPTHSPHGLRGARPTPARPIRNDHSHITPPLSVSHALSLARALLLSLSASLSNAPRRAPCPAPPPPPPPAASHGAGAAPLTHPREHKRTRAHTRAHAHRTLSGTVGWLGPRSLSGAGAPATPPPC